MKRAALMFFSFLLLGAVCVVLFDVSSPATELDSDSPPLDVAEPETENLAPQVEEDADAENSPSREVATATVESVKSIAEIVAAAPASAVRARVEDADGNPIAGANATLRPDGFDRAYGLLEGFERTARTDSKGYVAFDVRPIGSYRIAIEKLGYARGDLSPLFPGDDVLITLNPGTGLEIVVLDEASGQPVTGAAALLDASGPTKLARTGEEGRAAFVDLAAAVYSLEVIAPGYDRYRLEGVQVEKSERRPPPLEVRLAPGLALNGVVRSQKNQAPLAGADVRYRIERRIDGEETPLVEIATVTDAAGTYRFDGVARGTGFVEVTVAEYADERVSVRDPDEQDEIRVDVEMRLAALASGRVRTQAGEPVEGATVRVRRRDGPSSAAAEVTTDAAGEFTLDGIKPGREFDVLARGPDATLAPGALRDIVVPPAGLAQSLEIVLEPAAALAGRVTNADGSPAPFARIVMTEVSENVWRALDSAPLAFCDEDGKFRMVGLPAKTVNVRAEWNGLRSAVTEVVLPVAAEATCELVLDKSAAVRGFIVDANGAPVEGARVSLAAQSRTFDSTLTVLNNAQSGGDGRDNRGGNGGNGGRNSPPAPAPKPTLPTVKVGDRTIDLAELRSRGDDSRWGMVGRAAGTRDRLASTRGTTTSDADGSFAITGLDTGEKFALTVRHPDHETYFELDVTPSMGERRIELVPYITLRGRVVDSRSFQPVEDFVVEAMPVDMTPPVLRTVNDLMALRRQKSQTFSTFDGTFALRGLQPGYWDVTVRSSAYKSPAAQRINLLRGQKPEILVELIPAAWIRGRILARDGSPVRRVPVTLRVAPPLDENGKPMKVGRTQQKRGESNNRGDFSFTNLEPNVYLLSIGSSSKPIGEPVRIELKDGELKEYVFDVGEVGNLDFEVEGRGGFGVAGAQISLQGAKNRVRLRARTNGIGELSFDNLLPDDYRVTVDAAGYQRHEETVTVKPGDDRDETIHLSAR
jgi:protocatechuate 3,4-dioxygenase beta subunit